MKNLYQLEKFEENRLKIYVNNLPKDIPFYYINQLIKIDVINYLKGN
jgi:hypothetical protein